MNKHHKALELNKILDLLADCTSCADSREAALSLTPATELYDAQTLINQTDAAYVLLAKFGSPSFGAIKNVNSSLARAAAGGALTMRELLGTWQENAARFRAGQTVTGIVRTVTDYGAFIALTPNLCGLAETDGRLRPGQAVCVFIRAILPETLRIKLTVLHPLEALPPQALVYTRTEGHLDLWRYGTPDRAKAVTIF